MLNSTTAQASQRVVIILNDLNDWDEWLEIVKTKAKVKDVWEYVNSEKIIILTLVKSDFLKSIDVNLMKITITDLTANKKKEL